MTTFGSDGYGTLGYGAAPDRAPELILPTGNAVCHRIWQEVRALPQSDGVRVVFAELAGEIARLEGQLAECKRAADAQVPELIAAPMAHE